MVRRCYDEYDKELADLITDNLAIKGNRAANVRHGSDLCQNTQPYEDYQTYKNCETRRFSEIKGLQDDQAAMARNIESIVRLQHSLLNIRGHLIQMGLHYQWFKVRTTNGIDRF